MARSSAASSDKCSNSVCRTTDWLRPSPAACISCKSRSLLIFNSSVTACRCLFSFSSEMMRCDCSAKLRAFSTDASCSRRSACSSFSRSRRVVALPEPEPKLTDRLDTSASPLSGEENRPCTMSNSSSSEFSVFAE